MSKNQILYRTFLWIFLFTLCSSIIFAYLQGRHPEHLDANIFYSSTLGFCASALIMIIYAYVNQHQIYFSAHRTTTITITPPPENYTGPRDDFTGELKLEPDIILKYKHAWHKPIVERKTATDYHLSDFEFMGCVWITVYFGNGMVFIDSYNDSISITETQGDISISVQVGSKARAVID